MKKLGNGNEPPVAPPSGADPSPHGPTVRHPPYNGPLTNHPNMKPDPIVQPKHIPGYSGGLIITPGKPSKGK